jgi:hypothetical protein
VSRRGRSDAGLSSDGHPALTAFKFTHALPGNPALGRKFHSSSLPAGPGPQD